MPFLQEDGQKDVSGLWCRDGSCKKVRNSNCRVIQDKQTLSGGIFLSSDFLVFTIALQHVIAHAAQQMIRGPKSANGITALDAKTAQVLILCLRST